MTCLLPQLKLRILSILFGRRPRFELCYALLLRGELGAVGRLFFDEAVEGGGGDGKFGRGWHFGDGSRWQCLKGRIRVVDVYEDGR